MKPALLVLAAGLGNRYGGLKQLEPLGPGGETFIDYSIHDALRRGFGRAVFVIRREIEPAFRDAVGKRFEGRLEVAYAFQDEPPLPPGRAKPWGTGHAILVGGRLLKTPFAVVNGDDFYGARSFDAVSRLLSKDSDDHGMVAFTLRNTLSEHGSVSRGVCDVGEDGYLRAIVERTEVVAGHGVTGDELVSMNMWAFRPSIVPFLAEMFDAFRRERGADPKAEFFIPSAVNALIERGQARVKALRTPDSCFGVTYREDAPAARAKIAALIARGDYPERLWS